MGLIALLMVAAPASAGVSWCRSDPIIMVDGQVANILVSKDANHKAKITGATLLVVEVPSGSDYRLIDMDNGFGFGYQITFVENSNLVSKNGFVEVRVKVMVPADDSSLPVRVELQPQGKVKSFNKVGSANEWFATGTARL